MTSRLARLWQAGDPQRRLFLPDLWVAVVETPTCGRERLPKNAVKFRVHPAMSKHDIYECLTKVYKLPVRDIRTAVRMGEIEWQNKTDAQYKRALWKGEDKKFAYVFMEKNFVFDFPRMFEKSEEEVELSKMKEQQEKAGHNTKFVNRNRKNIATLLSV